MAKHPGACGAVDCRPPAAEAPPPIIPRQPQAVDYMAKDYDSFLRALLDQLPPRLPGWRDRTEADLGMAILELFAYLGDHLSYYQDRVAAEAFLPTASQHESVRKLLRLIDYRMDPGRAARALLVFEVSGDKILPADFPVRTEAFEDREPVIFLPDEGRILFVALNHLLLAADAAAGGTVVVLAAELAAGMLPPGSWLRLETPDESEWGRVASTVAVDPVGHTTTVPLEAPLGADYPAATAQVRGNVVAASHGTPRYQTATGSGEPGQSAALGFAPLTYLDDGAGGSRSTLEVRVDGELWHEVEDFIASGPADRHFRLSRDNEGYVTVHFGDGTYAQAPQVGADVVARYRTGIGEAGNVGADTLTQYDDPDSLVTTVSNPQPSFGARDPETPDAARRLGPPHLAEQNRAVTEADYAAVALLGAEVGDELILPLHARGRFQWTGSWTSVVVSLDMGDRLPPPAPVKQAFERALAEKKLAGYDVRVEAARYAPLHITLFVHVRANFFARQVRHAVEKAMASQVHADGTVGFFAPERFGFGQDVHLSDLYAAAAQVPGVEAVAVGRFKRLGDRYGDREAEGFIAIGDLEIARCDNDPAHPENGVLTVRTCGGKEG